MTAPTEIRAPLEQEGTKAVVLKWLKAVGEFVRVDEPVVELETDKVAVEIAAEADGVLAEILIAAGADAAPGAVLGRMRAAGSAPQTAHPRESGDPGVLSEGSGLAEKARVPAFAGMSGGGGSIAAFDPALRLSPSVRRRLIEAELDPAGLVGTGRDGRLTRADVDAVIAARDTAPPAARAPSPAAPTPAGALALAAAIPHTAMRRSIAEHMSRSVATAPHVTAVFEADFSAISAHRQAHKADFEAQGASLTYTAYIVLAAAEAMKVAPSVNSRWYEDRLDVYADVNIGLGVALGEKGLIVPVVRQVQTLSLLGVAKALQDVTARARAGRLTPAEVRDGTFSISNHGVSGSLVATPIIINQPQSAILGVGKLEKRVVVREVDGVDTIQIRPMAYVSLTIDHRVVDGHQTNAWLSRFVDVLERWPRD